MLAEIVRVRDDTYLIRPRSGELAEKRRFARVRSNADGSIVLTMVSEFISSKEVGTILGLHRTSIYRLARRTDPDGKPLLEAHCRSANRKLFSLDSVTRHLERSRDPEFWESLRNTAARKSNRKAPAKHTKRTR